MNSQSYKQNSRPIVNTILKKTVGLAPAQGKFKAKASFQCVPTVWLYTLLPFVVCCLG